MEPTPRLRRPLPETISPFRPFDTCFDGGPGDGRAQHGCGQPTDTYAEVFKPPLAIHINHPWPYI